MAGALRVPEAIYAVENETTHAICTPSDRSYTLIRAGIFAQNGFSYAVHAV